MYQAKLSIQIPDPTEPAAPDIRRQVITDCINCGLCAAHCAFLSGQILPGRMAAAYENDPGPCLDLAFDCSLCGLCAAVCPKHLDLPALFLAWRREAVSSGRADLRPYHGILGYEKKGCSPLFSFYHLPQDCDTVFFPGCTLTGTRPDKTLKAFDYLKTRIPGMGMVLDCCTKPSHDLGRTRFFKAMFEEMCTYLTDCGITTIITACPSCHSLFAGQSRFETVSVYQIMAEDEGFAPLPRVPYGTGPAVVQDPCQARNDKATQQAARTLAARAGLAPVPDKRSGPEALCCGEGAAVGCVSPGFARSWQQKRQKAAGEMPALTYCAGCTSRLGRGSVHLLDLMFDRDKSLKGRAAVASAPWTYLHRLRVKQHLKSLPAARTRVRWFHPEKSPQRKPGLITKSTAAAVLVLMVLATGAGILLF